MTVKSSLPDLLASLADVSERVGGLLNRTPERYVLFERNGSYWVSEISTGPHGEEHEFEVELGSAAAAERYLILNINMTRHQEQQLLDEDHLGADIPDDDEPSGNYVAPVLRVIKGGRD